MVREKIVKESFHFRSQEKLTDFFDTVLDLEEPEQKAPAQFSTNDDQTSLFLDTLQFLVFTKQLGDILESADDPFESSQPRRFGLKNFLCIMVLAILVFIALFIILTLILIECGSEYHQPCYWRYGRPF